MPERHRIRLVDSPVDLARRARALGELRGVSLAGAAHHGAADLLEPQDVDLVVVGLCTDGFDRCGGLDSVTRLAEVLPRERIVVLADRRVGSVVRLRAAHAGAGGVIDGGIHGLVRHLRQPDPGWRRIEPWSLERLGLRLGSRPGAGVRYVVERRLEAAFVAPATLEASGLSRRRSITVRTHLSRIVGIEVTDPGSGAVLPRQLPSWRQVHAVITAARGGSPAR
jgi:hypothetical protein